MTKPAPETFLNGRVTLHPGDCLEVLARLDPESVDSVVTDPPYHLTSIVKRFGAENAAPAKAGKTGAYARASRGFMGKQWDGGDIAFRPELWAAVLRVLKPGGHVVAFSGTRTYHRMACAIEDAGFEIRDSLQWLYGSGFPKSHDVSKAIDKHLGVSREQVRDDNPRNPKATGGGRDGTEGATRPWIEAAIINGYHEKDGPIPATAAAAAWDGFGTALKPACEPICLARKPLIGTVAENVLKHGTGSINIDACRVGSDTRSRSTGQQISENTSMAGGNYSREIVGTVQGRWPANIIHDGSDEVVGAFPQSDGGIAVQRNGGGMKIGGNGIYGGSNPTPRPDAGYNDTGSAARFFYTAKADADDRLGSKHPTVKPLDLMQWLVRLVTPKGGLVLDPFAGTGTTGEAAWREGMRAVLIEREPEYQTDIARRMANVLAGPDERKRVIAKTKNVNSDFTEGLFAR